MDKQWWKEAVVYQIYPRSFQDSTGNGVGDLNGITRRLDYLKDLGIDVIWLSPVYASPNVDNGYDISDYQAIMDDFGTMEDFDRLLGEAHGRGIKIVMDLVVNHTSDAHQWFLESRSSRNNPKRDWYIWRDGYRDGPPNLQPSVFSGSAWQYDEKTGQYYLHLFAKEQPDLNWANPEVRDAVYRMMSWWLDKGIDGFRMDVIDCISKPPAALAADGGPGVDCNNGPEVHTYLKEMNKKVLSRYDIMTVGENSGATPENARIYAGTDTGELNMVFQFEVMFVDHDPKLGKWKPRPFRLTEIKKIMTKWQTGLYQTAWNSLYWNNHDQPRVVSRFGNDGDEFREKSAKMLATCLHMMLGTPYIYQGEELGMTNMPFGSMEDVRDVEAFNAYRELVTEKKALVHEEMMAGINKNGRDNARTPMQWNAEKNAGFSSGTPWIPVNPNFRQINAAAQVEDPNSVWAYYRRLIRFRKEHPVIIYGNYELLLPEDEQVYAYRRGYEGTTALVICNFSGDTVKSGEAANLAAGAGPLLLANYPEEAPPEILRPYEARVYGN
ncbi:MAG: alpha-glucosidase [Spirochaetaceae bacterium]|jgi:oligo-1,6-glucosidase|nr:alpha-glucosidase [Spirochaetaceae bacterium]